MSSTIVTPRLSASAPDNAPDRLPVGRRRLRRALSFEVIPPRSPAQAARMPRLLKFLDNFLNISSVEIPHASILREFIGGSSFRY